MKNGEILRNSSPSVWAGQALYTSWFLFMYDWLALGLNCRLVWGCPHRKIVEMYNRHVSGNHLDIGVGTGYFLDKCRFPVADPRLVLVDLNSNSLSKAGKRLSRYRPAVYRRNILEPLVIPEKGFDSIGLCHLLHCLPGNTRTKGVVFESVKGLLNQGGTVFGATFLYRGIRRSPLATFMFWWTNYFGFMTNKEDDLDGLARNLEEHFTESHIELRGCEALFWAKK